jgi:hypothetical protein
VLLPLMERNMIHEYFQTKWISPQGWNTIQQAHDRASIILDRSPKDHEFSERLAREVIRLYKGGIHNVDQIADAAVKNEMAILDRGGASSKIG